MNWQRTRKLLAVPLVLILQLVAIPIGAGEVPSAEVFSLHLEDALGVEMLAVDAVSPEFVEPEKVPAIGITELQSLAVADSFGLARELSDQASAQTDSGEKGGVGRWLKKHWYVPVLAAVVLGVVLVGDDDNDKEGDDD